MWATKLLISPVKKRIFCPKTTKFGPKWAVLVNLGQAMQAYSMPCWWVGWWLWHAGCISQDTYLLYIAFYRLHKSWPALCWYTTCIKAGEQLYVHLMALTCQSSGQAEPNFEKVQRKHVLCSQNYLTIFNEMLDSVL